MIIWLASELQYSETVFMMRAHAETHTAHCTHLSRDHFNDICTETEDQENVCDFPLIILQSV